MDLIEYEPRNNRQLIRPDYRTQPYRHPQTGLARTIVYNAAGHVLGNALTNVARDPTSNIVSVYNYAKRKWEDYQNRPSPLSHKMRNKQPWHRPRYGPPGRKRARNRSRLGFKAPRVPWYYKYY